MGNDEVIKKALFYTNSAFLMADIANTFAIEAESQLAKPDKGFDGDQLKRYKRAVKLARDLKDVTRHILRPFYELSYAESACNDSDYIGDVVKLVINRTSDNEESKKAMLEHIRQLPEVEHEEA